MRASRTVLRALAAIGVGCLATHSAAAQSRRDLAAPIPDGVLTMGTDSAELPGLEARFHTTRADLFASEMPRRSVHVAAFRLDRTEVTKAAFRAFLVTHMEWVKDAVDAQSHNGHYLDDWRGLDFADGEGNRPVANVTWQAAAAFCAWAGGRLPSEAEWEYAAHGGLADAEYPWGTGAPDSTSANWLGANVGHTTDVGRFAPNGYGLYDMAGNVWELTADAWPADTARLSSGARLEGSSARHVIRGGSYGGAAVNLRVRYRDSHPDGGAAPFVGFRCAYAP